MSLNIQSISAKFNEFSELINVLSNLNCAPDIICLQEIWRFPTYHNFKLANYHLFVYKIRESSQGGGEGFFVKNSIKFKILPELSVFSEKIIETLFIEVTISNKRFIIGNIYRSGTTHPNLTNTQMYNEFMELFSNVCDSLIGTGSDVVLMGDFNIDILQYGSNTRASDYVDLLFSYGFLQTVAYPTRCTDNSASLIDHVITNIKLSTYKSVILSSRVSDHFPVIFSIPLKVPAPIKHKTVQSRVFNETTE